MRRIASLFLLGLVLACAQEQPVPDTEQPATAAKWYDEGANLLSLLRGATITDRSGELSLESSAMLAIDGHPVSAWVSPPENIEQWLIAELPVQSRVDAVGFSVGAIPKIPACAKDIRWELSLDGSSWTDVGTFSFGTEPGNQLREITPVEARFARITVLTNHGNTITSRVPTLLLQGEEAGAYQRPSVAGHWMLNNLSAQLKEDGDRVFGYVAMNPPMLIDGAWDGRIVRFAWSRGRSYGVGFITVNPEGQTLDCIWWYENATGPGTEMGNPWFGTRLGDPDDIHVDTSSIAQLHIERDGRFPLFGLTFDDSGNFQPEASRAAVDFIKLAVTSFPQFRVRLEVDEFHSPDEKQNLAKSRILSERLQKGLEGLGLPMDRIIVTEAGSQRPYPSRYAPLEWAMYSRVDFSLTAVE